MSPIRLEQPIREDSSMRSRRLDARRLPVTGFGMARRSVHNQRFSLGARTGMRSCPRHSRSLEASRIPASGPSKPSTPSICPAWRSVISSMPTAALYPDLFGSGYAGLGCITRRIGSLSSGRKAGYVVSVDRRLVRLAQYEGMEILAPSARISLLN